MLLETQIHEYLKPLKEAYKPQTLKFGICKSIPGLKVEAYFVAH